MEPETESESRAVTRDAPAVVILIGVAGAGKTTVGRLLARELGWPFYDGDDFHPPGNVARMARGVPLTDADRAPWLERLRRLIDDIAGRGGAAVIACSALKRSYRELLAGGSPRAVRFVYLAGNPSLFRGRLEGRGGHFMKARMLASQLSTLEEPAAEEALRVDAAFAPEVLVGLIRRRLGL